MQRLLILLLLSVLPLVAADRQMPPTNAPGGVSPAVTQANLAETVCKPNWSAGVRPPTSYTNNIKRNLMKVYGLPGAMDDYELDHRLEIAGGGDPRDVRNLWMQPWPEARLKDRLEAYEHRQLCASKITLKQEQAVFLGNFWKEYDRLAPSQGWPVWKGN